MAYPSDKPVGKTVPEIPGTRVEGTGRRVIDPLKQARVGTARLSWDVLDLLVAVRG
jgi:hypothetical protein